MPRRLKGAFRRTALPAVALVLFACAAPSAPPAATGAAKPAANTPAAPTTAPAAPAAAPAKPAPPVRVRGAWVAETANQMLWPAAVEAGYFQEYGVDFDLTYIQGSVTSVQTLLSGDLDVTNVAGSAVVLAQAEGADLIMVAGFLNQPIFRVLAMGDIRRIDDVKGKAAAVTRVGNADYFAWQTIIEKLGWKPDDVRFVSAQTVAGQVTMLATGDAQVIAISPPNNVLAEDVGAHEILDTVTLNEPEQNNGFAVSRKFATENRAAVLNVTRASIAAMARWKRDPAFIKEVIRKYLRLDNQRFIDVGYEAYLPVWPEVPYPTREGFAKVIQQVSTQNPKAAGLNPDQLMDMSFVRELEDSGFIRQIYARQ